ncbi:NifB/NifX family molybdenum-iron cluster-binding protein [uncultured Lutibacter sp.]|uniref:NifB/NifX family molybdenum-iron cluster-binding protein n=1 Tax=uncultured Lutibacter sp. TaxID=437739 RepID=UPI002638AE6D|nr:NifB/NifX family molybdenum-iron cluster-binding protein [uncultured Lutibacter sp.]
MRKIAIPVGDHNQIDEHFGHCKYYEIYTVSDENKIVDMQTLPSEEGCGCKSNIASVLANHGVNIMLAGRIGAGAINVLNKWNIDVIRGCSGSVETNIKQFVEGQISDSGETCMQHGDDHQCSH